MDAFIRRDNSRSLLPRWIGALVGVCIIAGAAVPAMAAIVLLKQKAEPIYGSIVRRDRDRVVLRVVAADGKATEEAFRTEDIADVVETVSSERLEALDPARPSDYRDYAEELYGRRRDPEARNMAIRLYAIAAWLDRNNKTDRELTRSALLGLIVLARSPQEQQNLRVMLYLLDPSVSSETLQRQPTVVRVDNPDISAAQELLRAVRFLRTGKGPTARNLLEKPGVAQLLARYSRILSQAEFTAASSQTVLSARELRQALTLELELESMLRPTEGNLGAVNGQAWSIGLRGNGDEPVEMFDMESLTEFNPRLCVYRQGKWVER